VVSTQSKYFGGSALIRAQPMHGSTSAAAYKHLII